MKNMPVNNFRYRCFFVGLFLFILLGSSCTSSLESKEEVFKYINDPDNGLTKTEKAREVDIKLTYQPWQLIASRLGSSAKDKQAEMSKYADKRYFILSFSKDEKELLRQLDFNSYSEMVQVFAFRMPAYISLLTEGGGPIAPDDCLFQQTYGASNANSLLLIFKKNDIERADELKIRVQEFGLGLGNIVFSLNKKDITNIPNIDLKNL